jgi:hypothetical protein
MSRGAKLDAEGVLHHVMVGAGKADAATGWAADFYGYVSLQNT